EMLFSPGNDTPHPNPPPQGGRGPFLFPPPLWGRVRANTVQRRITTASGKVFFKGGRCRCSGRFFFHFDIFRLITRGLIRFRSRPARLHPPGPPPFPRLERRSRPAVAFRQPALQDLEASRE